MNNKINVEMGLRRSGKWLWGTYRYIIKGKPKSRLYIVGRVTNKNLVLQEFDFIYKENSAEHPKFTGEFVGVLENNRCIAGNWSNPDKTNTSIFRSN